jgi:hypothetical protein
LLLLDLLVLLLMRVRVNMRMHVLRMLLRLRLSSLALLLLQLPRELSHLLLQIRNSTSHAAEHGVRRTERIALVGINVLADLHHLRLDVVGQLVVRAVRSVHNSGDKDGLNSFAGSTLDSGLNDSGDGAGHDGRDGALELAAPRRRLLGHNRPHSRLERQAAQLVLDNTREVRVEVRADSGGHARSERLVVDPGREGLDLVREDVLERRSHFVLGLGCQLGMGLLSLPS